METSKGLEPTGAAGDAATDAGLGQNGSGPEAGGEPTEKERGGGLAAGLRSLGKRRFVAVLVLLLAECAFFAITQDYFLTKDNLLAMLTSNSILWVTAMGLTFVLLVGGFDLSIAANLQLTGIFIGTAFLDLALPGAVVFVLALLFGAALGGLINGFLIGRLGLSFLIVTLGTLSLFQGISLIWADNETRGVTSSFLTGMAFNSFLGIPILVWIMIGTLGAGLYVLRGTYFGRDVYAVGGNADAARVAGIRVERTIMWAYGIAGLGAGLGAAIQVGRISAASPQLGDAVLFSAAAAVLIGGTSFAGGIGGVGGTAIGVLFVGVLANGLTLSGVNVDWQLIVTGAILLVVVIVDLLQRPEGRAKLGLGRFTSRREPEPAAVAAGPGTDGDGS